MDKVVLQFNKIKKSYDSLKVLAKTSFAINKEEIVCLLGPSGCGKTTLFKIAAEIIKPDQGQIKCLPKVRKAYVFQEPRLIPWKTVSQNISFVQKNYLGEQRAKLIRDSLLELTGLQEFTASYPKQLSGGMKQRLEIIRALSIQPDLLLLDEPFKSVDAQTKLNLQQMILRFQEKMKFSIFLITHDPDVAVLMADRIYVLSQKPAKVIKEFNLERPQCERTLKNEEIFEIREEIIELFINLVEEYRWEKDEETNKILQNFKIKIE